MDGLSKLGNVMPFATTGFVYEAISGHPDIFFCPVPGGLVVAPGLPERYFSFLAALGVSFFKGVFDPGPIYPQSARYNALADDLVVVYNPKSIDPAILEHCDGLKRITVKQGYVRCNLVSLGNGNYLVSDRGIEKRLVQEGMRCVYVDARQVALGGFAHGFVGGAFGRTGRKLLLGGMLHYFNESELILQLVDESGLQLIELYPGPPFDLGTLLVLA